MNSFFISSVLVGVSSLGFGLLVFIRSSNSRLARRWFIFVSSVAVYGCFTAWIAIEKDPGLSLKLWWLDYMLGVIWISPLFYHFVNDFLGRPAAVSIRTHYGIALVFTCVTPTRAFFSGTRWVFNSFHYAQGGWLYYIYGLWWWGLVIYSHFLLAQAGKSIPSTKQNQIRYFFLAMALSFSGGIICYLPNYGVHIYPWGQWAIPLYPLIMSYAILKHQLMDVRLVIRKTLIYSMVTALLTAVYVVIVFGLAVLLQKKFSAIPAASSYAIAAIAITALFHPLRMRIQRWVDRYFFRVLIDDQFVQELTSGFVHELKRPLATIIAPAELVLQDIRDILSGRRLMAELLPKTEQRVRHIINAALDASHRIEAVQELNSSQTHATQRIALNTLLEKSLKLENSAIQEAQINVEYSIPDILPIIVCYPNQLELVFLNLIRNAIEAMQSSAVRHLVISGGLHSKGVFISVADSGPGIMLEHQSRVFEPYFTTKASRGMGMGLYLSQQVIKAHGGSIRVQSSSIGGAEFVVELPADL